MALSRVISTSPTITTPVTVAKIFRKSNSRGIAAVLSTGILTPDITVKLGRGVSVEADLLDGSWVNGFLVGNPFTTPILEPPLPDALMLLGT